MIPLQQLVSRHSYRATLTSHTVSHVAPRHLSYRCRPVALSVVRRTPLRQPWRRPSVVAANSGPTLLLPGVVFPRVVPGRTAERTEK